MLKHNTESQIETFVSNRERSRVDGDGHGHSRARASAPVTVPVTVPVAPQGPCLDYRSKSDTARPGRDPQVYNRARVFRSGEVEIRTVMVNATSKPPRPAYGKRTTRGVSARGRRTTRRAVAAFVRANRCKPTLYTLTSHAIISDEDFNRAVGRFMRWLRKWVPSAALHYVRTTDLQQRGVLHAHLLLFQDMPREVWLRARRLWTETYGMGVGSFDAKRVKRPSRAAAYVARYISKQHDGQNRRIGRNGEPYVRERFSGNAYAMSDALRAFAQHVTEFALPWTTGPVLGAVNLRGCVLFFDDPEKAHQALGLALSPPTSESWQA